MSDAVVFAQFEAARRLLARGARTTFTQAAGLGLLDRVEEGFAGLAPFAKEITEALWFRCRGGHRNTADNLLDRGADLNWVGWGEKTPLDAAHDSDNGVVVDWLRGLGAKSNRSSG